MEKSMSLKLNWASLQHQLCPEETSNAFKGMINYKGFLAEYSIGTLGDKSVPEAISPSLSTLYENYPLLKAIFHKWDVNKDGKIDRAEFTNGLRVLNSHLVSEGEELSVMNNPDELFDVLDIDGSGHIELDEFCESYRLFVGAVN